MTRAEQKSIEWQKAHNPMAIGGGKLRRDRKCPRWRSP